MEFTLVLAPLMLGKWSLQTIPIVIIAAGLIRHTGCPKVSVPIWTASTFGIC